MRSALAAGRADAADWECPSAPPCTGGGPATGRPLSTPGRPGRRRRSRRRACHDAPRQSLQGQTALWWSLNL
eukprot:1062080-Pyramimonas_sp.AAC.1